jgi:hypothetical protein
MVYHWFLLCQCIQRPQWQHIVEMGLPCMNVCRGHIMLTLAMCYGPCQCIQRPQRQHIGEMGLPCMNVCRGHVMLTSAMCSGPCQCIKRPQRQDIGDVGEMGLPGMNVCRGHIMLTLDMCSGPLGVTLGRVYHQILGQLLWQCMGCSHVCKRLVLRLEQGLCDWSMSSRNVGM